MIGPSPNFLIPMCGDAVTENNKRYRKKINYLFLHQLQDICDNDDDVDLVDLSVQKDGATCHRV